MKTECSHNNKIVYIVEELCGGSRMMKRRGELVLNANFDLFYELARRLQSPMYMSGILGDRDYLFE